MTVKNRSTLNSDADTNLADNTTGDITPADLRTIVKDVVDSALLAEDVATVATSGSYSDLSGTPTLGTSASKNITISTSDPSGGSNGDIWFKVA